MPNATISACPVCASGLRVERLRCPACRTAIEGEFAVDRFATLNEAQKDFVVSFIRCRGNIRDMEKELGISYPTVRARLDDIAQALGQPAVNARRDALQRLQNGEIDVTEALNMLTTEEKDHE